MTITKKMQSAGKAVKTGAKKAVQAVNKAVVKPVKHATKKAAKAVDRAVVEPVKHGAKTLAKKVDKTVVRPVAGMLHSDHKNHKKTSRSRPSHAKKST